jgi:hypothetical protein
MPISSGTPLTTMLKRRARSSAPAAFEEKTHYGNTALPRTTNTAILEALAGVPAGTAAALAAYERAHKPAEVYGEQSASAWEAHFDNMTAAMSSYDHFIVYGWGRLTRAASDAAAREPGQVRDGYAICGATAEGNTDAVRAILAGQGVTLPHTVDARALDGLTWS